MIVLYLAGRYRFDLNLEVIADTTRSPSEAVESQAKVCSVLFVRATGITGDHRKPKEKGPSV
ncbi:MAG: hypothetical protein ACR2NZ_10440 [Rubripirellula sp.]